jgi:hypothetical protein
MPEQGDIVRGDERFAQVLGEAVYLESEVRFSDSPWPGDGTQWCGDAFGDPHSVPIA